MASLTPENPWVFTTVNVVVWAAVCGLVQVVLFDGGVFQAVVEAEFAGIVFSMLSLYLK